MSRVFMIGWDGATFDIIRPWVEQGKLPNLARLMEAGVHGPLQSTIPPWSFQAWSSFLTGKNPGKHGIYDFFRTPPGTYDLEFVNADHRRGGASFWQLLGDAGRKVIAVSIPGTFPPDKVNGIMISGFDFPGDGPGSYVDTRGMYPPELYQELLASVGRHPIDAPILKDLQRGQYHVALERILDTIRQQSATAKYLMTKHPWDCFMIVFGESDGASHHFWQYCDPSSLFFKEEPSGLRDSILRVYQELDKQAGELLTLLPSDTNVFLVSDHGSGGVSDWVIFPNCWLQQHGYVRLRNSRTRLLSRLREKAKRWGVAALPSWIQRPLYRNAWRALGRFESRVRYGIIDWSQTQAYFDENPYYPVLRINLRGRQPHGIVEPGAYEELRDRLIQDLEAWRHPLTAEPIVERAFRREEVYSGPCLEEAADIVPKWALHRDQNYGFRLSSQSKDLSWIAQINPHDPKSKLYPKKFSSHRDQAVFVARGPNIQCGVNTKGIRIIDLAPTILDMLDVPVPQDMDGRVLNEIFVEKQNVMNGFAPVPEKTDSEAVVDANEKLMPIGESES